jgi:hypothetical protein
LAREVHKTNRLLPAKIMKTLLTLAVLATSVAAPVFAVGWGAPPSGSVPDGGATAVLAAISFGVLAIAKSVTKKR